MMTAIPAMTARIGDFSALHRLLSRATGIEGSGRDTFSDPTRLFERLFPDVELIFIVHDAGTMSEKKTLYAAFQSEEDGIEFKLKYL